MCARVVKHGIFLVYDGLSRFMVISVIPFHGIYIMGMFTMAISIQKKSGWPSPWKKIPKVANRSGAVETLKKNWPICGIFRVGVFLSFFIRFWGATSWTFTIGSSSVIICFANSKLTELSNLQQRCPPVISLFIILLTRYVIGIHIRWFPPPSYKLIIIPFISSIYLP